MAEKVDGIHNHIIGNIDVKIEEIHRIMTSMATPGSLPWIGPSSRQGTDISLTEILNTGTQSSLDLRKPVMAPAQAEEDLNSLVVTKSSDRECLPEPLSPRPSRRRASSDLQDTGNQLQGLGISHVDETGSNLQTPELNGSEFSPGSSPEMQIGRDTRWSDLIPANPYNLPQSPSTKNNTKADSGSTRWSAVSDELPTVPDPKLFDNPQLAAARRPSSQYGLPTALSPIDLGSPVKTDSRTRESRTSLRPPSPRDGSLHPADSSAMNRLRGPPLSDRESPDSESSLNSIHQYAANNRSRRPSSPLLPMNLSPSNLSPYVSGETTSFSHFAPTTPSDTIFATSNLISPTSPLEPSGPRPWLSFKSNNDSGLLSPNESFEEKQASRKNPSTPSQLEQFQRSIFTDAAILCQAIGSSVEYTIPDEGKPGDWKLVEATKRCKISVVTKRFKLPNTDKIRYISSIWALSDDRTVRLQQRLLDDEEIIPYTIWGNTTKIVLRVPTELKYHGFTTLDKPVEIAKTNWVNYIFGDESSTSTSSFSMTWLILVGANEFQNALMGKRLIYSFCTRRTLRTYDNIVANTFTFQEQLCGLENLRLWTDDEGDGSVLGMIQYSANFREGYLAFRMGGPYTTVRVRDDSDKWVRIRGLNVTVDSSVDKKAMRRRKSSTADIKDNIIKKEKGEKKITGVRIEFVIMADKYRFMEQFKTARDGRLLRTSSP